MKVKEVIAELQKFDPELAVVTLQAVFASTSEVYQDVWDLKHWEENPPREENRDVVVIA